MEENIPLKPGERIDDLQRNGRRIIQDPARFCFGMDAVLLSDFANIRKNETVVDLGTGNGILPILLEAKTPGTHFIGLEIQEDSADMARRSVAMNQTEEKIEIITGDMKEAADLLGKNCYNVVVSNPPYMVESHGIQNPKDAKAIARHEVKMSLSDLLHQTKLLLKPNGRCYFVHRPFRLAEIIAGMVKEGLEPKRMQLVYPYVDAEPNMVLIEGRKGGKARMTVEKPRIIYASKDEYTEEVKQIYGF
ncbi:tRNA1Val (adenine37-N6)-methyltransferase [Lachnospiraceae bacterium KHCPX20]|nr:tRNA1Val (adenine37-N6)-methyltransferase [Lachnospiraceae bacterium KHCPX20]